MAIQDKHKVLRALNFAAWAMWLALVVNETEMLGAKICCHAISSDTLAWIAILLLPLFYFGWWLVESKACRKTTAGMTIAAVVFMSFSGLSFFSLRIVFDALTNGAFCNMRLVSEEALADGQVRCEYSDGGAGRMTARTESVEKPVAGSFCIVKSLKKVSPFRRF